MNILYLTSRLPIKPHIKGDTLRDYYLIKALYEKGHKITLISYFAGNQNNGLYLKGLKKYTAKTILVKLSILNKLVNLTNGLFSRIPFQAQIYNSSRMSRVISKQFSDSKFDIIYVHLLRMAPLVEDISNFKVIDLQDNLYENFNQRAKVEKNFLIKLLSSIDSKRMKAYSNLIINKFDCYYYISPRDAFSMKDEYVFKNKFYLLPNGVKEGIKRVKNNRRKNNTILFIGNMSYFPNKDAVIYLVKEIIPLVQKHIPDIKLIISGAKPGIEIKKFNSKNIIITGFVNDQNKVFEYVTLAIIPLRYSTGLQNKVLELAKAGVPQIISKVVSEGFFKKIKDEFIIVDENDPQAIATSIINLLSNENKREQISDSAYKYVTQNYSWEKSAEIIEKSFLENQKK